TFRMVGSTSEQVRAYVAMTESNIVYNNKGDYGNPTCPNTNWNDVFRAMYPSKEGLDPFSLSGQKEVTIPIDVPSGWNVENIKLVAWVQSTTPSTDLSYPVYGVAGIKVSELGVKDISDPSYSSLSLSPNPASIAANLKITTQSKK